MKRLVLWSNLWGRRRRKRRRRERRAGDEESSENDVHNGGGYGCSDSFKGREIEIVIAESTMENLNTEEDKDWWRRVKAL